MKLIKGILVVTALAVILCSVASAGNVNPVTVTMEGESVVGPGAGETGPIEGDLNGTVDSYQEFKFYTNSPWYVEVREATINEEGVQIGTFTGTLLLENGSTTGVNTVTRTNREILGAIANATGDDDFDPGYPGGGSWNTSKNYTVIITFWLWSDDKVGNTYVTDIITFTWDSVSKVWHQKHHIKIWSDGQPEIPEFPTIAIPALISLGIIFLMFRKRRKD